MNEDRSIPGSLDLSAPAADVADAFAFIEGFRVDVLRARAVDGEGEPGVIVRASDGWQVACGRGRLALESVRVWIDGEACDELSAFFDVCRIDRPRMTRVPFVDDAAVRAFEQRTERWRAHAGSGAPSAQHRLDRHEEWQRDNVDLVRFLLECVATGPGAQVIDVGCGTGWACAEFARQGCLATGVDLRDDALALARRLVPEARFEALDVFRLGERPDLAGRFDLVFCRGLGVAQRLIDWDDPAWVEVGARMVGLLKPGGLLYWTHHGTGSGLPGADGFSHPARATLERWFARSGVVLRSVDCVLQSFLVTRPDAPADLGRRVAEIDAAIRRRVLERHRAAFEAGAAPEREALAALSASAWAGLSGVRGSVFVEGAGRLAQLCAATCEAMGSPVVQAAAGAKVVSPEGAWDGPCVAPFAPVARETAVERTTLVTGDVDRYYEAMRLDRYAHVAWTSPPPFTAPARCGSLAAQSMRLHLILEIDPSGEDALARYLAGLPGRSAVLVPALSTLGRGSLPVVNERDVVPLGGEIEERLHREASLHRTGLRERLSAHRLLGVPLVDDLAVHLGVAHENLATLLAAAIAVGAQGNDHVVIALPGYTIHHLALLDHARRVGLAPPDEPAWLVRGGQLVAAPALPTGLDPAPFLAEFRAHPATSVAVRHEREAGLERTGGVLAILPSGEAHFVRNLAPVIRELRRREAPARVLAYGDAPRAALRGLGVETDLFLPPHDDLPDRPATIAGALEPFIAAYARDLEVREAARETAPGAGFLEDVDRRLLSADGYWGMFRLGVAIERLDTLIRTGRPRSVYVTPQSSYLERSAATLARKHGAVSVTSLFFSVIGTYRSYTGYSADLVTLLGRDQDTVFLERGYRPEQLLPVGQPELDEALLAWDQERSLAHVRARVPAFDPARRTVLIASATIDPAGELVWTEALAEWAHQAGAQVICKLHPSISSAPFAAIGARRPELPLGIVEDRELQPYLRVADLVVTDASHAGGLAVCLGKPLLVANLTGAPFAYNRFDEEGVAAPARSLDELRAQLDAFAAGTFLPGTGPRQDDYIARNFVKGDGRAAARIVDALLDPPFAPPAPSPVEVVPGPLFTDHRKLADELVRHVEEHGYFILRDFLDPRAVARVREELVELLDRDLEVREAARAGGGGPRQLHAGDISDHQHAVYFAGTHSAGLAHLMDQILANPTIQAFTDRVLGRHYRLRVDLVRRLTGVNDAVDDFQLPHEWHRDSPGEFTFGIPFDDVTPPSSGSTIVMPGTQALPYDPYWHMLLGRSAHIDKAHYLSGSPARVGPSLSRFAVFNRMLRNALKGRAVELSGRPGDIFFFLNSTWHGRAPNIHGQRNVIVRFGGFPTDFPFKDDIPLPPGIAHLPPTVRRRYDPAQPVNDDPSTLVRRFAAQPARVPDLYDAAYAEKRLLSQIALWTGRYD